MPLSDKSENRRTLVLTIDELDAIQAACDVCSLWALSSPMRTLWVSLQEKCVRAINEDDNDD